MENTAKYCRMGVGHSLWRISNHNYLIYEALIREYEEKYDSEPASSAPDIIELEFQILEAGYIAIVFAAMFLESEAYTYLAIHLSDSFVQKHLDKLDPLSKWIIGVKLVTGRSIQKDEQAYELCKQLFAYRNKLVHQKSKPLEFDLNKYSQIVSSDSQEFAKIVHISNNAVKELARTLDDINADVLNPLWFVNNDRVNTIRE